MGCFTPVPLMSRTEEMGRKPSFLRSWSLAAAMHLLETIRKKRKEKNFQHSRLRLSAMLFIAYFDWFILREQSCLVLIAER